MKPNASNPSNAHELRALINRLLRARLTWEEYLEPLDDIAAGAIAYTADHHGKTFVIAKTSDCYTLFCSNNSSLSKIAASESDGIHPELLGLFRHAERSYDDWIMEMSNSYFRQRFGDIVSIRDLFRMIDHPDQLAVDAADERTYIAVNAGRLTTEEEILDFHSHARREALRTIRSIIGCKKETESIMLVNNHDPNPMHWRVKIPVDFPAGKTDLHVRICPAYHVDDADGDMNREAAVKIAALLILLSL